jgi:hypothetical protein
MNLMRSKNIHYIYLTECPYIQAIPHFFTAANFLS